MRDGSSQRVLAICFTATIILATALGFTYKHIVPLTVCCLTVAVACLLVLISFHRTGAEHGPRAGLGPAGPAVTHQ